MKKLFRISTVPMSLNILLRGQLKFLDQHFDVTAISGSGKDLDEVKVREGVKVHSIEIQRQISPLKDIVSLVRLYQYFRKEKPDIIHSITPKAGLLSMVAGKWAGVPIRIHTFTGLVFPYREGFFQKILIVMDKILCSCATNVYPEGKGVKEDLKKFKITDKPLTLIGNGNVNGIDLIHFDPELYLEDEKSKLKTDLNISRENFVFVFIGRLVKDKGINELIAAFKKLNAQNVKLLLVGPYESKLDPLNINTLSEIENNPDIISAGYQKDVRPYFAISDALVFPSYREGFPNVVLQSLAMQIPVIVSDINGCNEIVENGQNGIIVPPKDESALQQAMTKLLEEKIYLKLKENSRSSILKYEQQKLWDAILREYQSFL
ncbi:glycosyltransferase family 4 protein [Epilithonimonas sp.]|jgi:glycosyltransferase involved in cell wall biosynthesis|uniref:glycosyltransferase family 4 protein n=1 Tax=Epilithonimonas sp. TaxID=2894511 RepID=UPI0035B1E85A